MVQILLRQDLVLATTGLFLAPLMRTTLHVPVDRALTHHLKPRLLERAVHRSERIHRRPSAATDHPVDLVLLIQGQLLRHGAT